MVSLDSVKLELARQVEGEVRFDAGTRAAYATDASNYRQVPVGVVIPRHEGDVIAALSIARENSMPILARGAATSLAGQACNAALVLDFSKYMKRVIAIEPGARVARVEPGVIQSHLNAALAPHGLFFAPDPSTKDRCTVGGMIGNNSCGAHSAAYGKTVDNVEALEVILYDGTQLSLTGSIADAEIGAAIARGGREGELYSRIRELRDQSADSVRAHFPRLPRRVSGYNLDELMPERGFNLARAIVGSEGTLAAVIRATIRAVPRPNELGLVVLGFDDVFIAADQTPWLLEHRPEALEGFDENLPEFARIKAMPGVRFLPAGRAFLLVELGGGSQDEARERAQRARLPEHAFGALARFVLRFAAQLDEQKSAAGGDKSHTRHRLDARELGKILIEAFQRLGAMLEQPRRLIPRDEYVVESEHDQPKFLRARHGSYRRADDCGERALRANDCAGKVEAPLRHQLVQVVPGDAARKPGETSAHGIGGSIPKFADGGVKLAFAAAARDCRAKCRVGNRTIQRKLGSVVEDDFQRLDVIDGLAVCRRMRAA